MKHTLYKNELIAKGSQAHELWLVATKSGKPEDFKALDKHLKQLNDAYKKLHY